MSDSTTDNAPAPAPAPEVVDAAATAAAADATDVAVTAAAAAEGEAAATTEGTDGADADAAAGGGGAPADGGAPAATDQGEPDPNTGWLPLESNPDIVNPFAHDMGMPKEWSFCDIYGLEDWAFDMIPKPVAAVVLLFASSAAASAYKLKQHKDIVEQGGQVIDPSLFYMTQVDGIGNACGTIACMHTLLNCGAHFQLSESALTKFAGQVKDLSPLARGEALLKSEGLREISDSTAANEAASTECPDASEATNAHFITFVEIGGTLYELDGRKAFPINHGAVGEGQLLQCAAKVIKRDFMDVNPDEVRFNMMALAKHS